MYKDIVRTSSPDKQNFRYNMAYFLGQDSISRWRYMKDIVMMLKNNSDLNKLKEDLGDDYETAMRKLRKFDTAYRYADELKKTIAITKDDEIRNKLTAELSDLCSIIPEIDYNLLMVFYHLTKRADIKDMSVPGKHILSAKDNKLEFRDVSEEQKAIDVEDRF